MPQKYKIFSLIFLLLFFGFFLKELPAESTWVINPHRIPGFNSQDEERLKTTLSFYDIKVIYDRALENSFGKPPLAPSQYLSPLLEGKHVRVYLITPSQGELHIGVGVKNMRTLQGEALSEFTEMTRHIIQVFHDLEYGDYLAFCDFGKRYSLLKGGEAQDHCWEMIPLGKRHTLNKNGTYALAPKIWRNGYVLFNQTPFFKKEEPRLVEKFTKILKARLTHNLSHSPLFKKETLPWEITISDFGETKKATLNRLLTELQTLKAVKVIEEKEKASFPKGIKAQTGVGEEFSSLKKHTQQGCAFCKKKVIETQEMFRGRSSTVLYNYSPYIKDKHFMVVPLSHEESFYGLPCEHFEEIIHLAQKVTFALGSSKNIIWFSQNGPYAGQTTPHAHLHVLERPDPVFLLTKILNILAEQKDTPLTEKDYQEVQRKLLQGFDSVEQRKN